MSGRAFTAKDMAEIESKIHYQKWNERRVEHQKQIDNIRDTIERYFPPAEGWYWCQGVDGELYLKEGP